MRSHLHIGRNCAAAAGSAPATTLRLGGVPPRIRALLTVIAAATLSGLLLIVTDARPAISQAVRLVTVDVNTVAQGYRVSKLTGSGVTNEKNEKIGTIDDFVIARNLPCSPCSRSVVSSASGGISWRCPMTAW